MEKMDLIVERLTPSSPALLTISEWFHQEWGHYHPGQDLQGRVEDTKKLCREEGNNQPPITWVAYNQQGELVGTIGILLNDLATRPELNPWLASFYIHKDYRGKGYGSMLFQYLMDQLPSMGIKELYLFTHDRESMYARFGWKVMERSSFYGDEIAIMHYQVKEANSR